MFFLPEIIMLLKNKKFKNFYKDLKKLFVKKKIKIDKYKKKLEISDNFLGSVFLIIQIFLFKKKEVEKFYCELKNIYIKYFDLNYSKKKERISKIQERIDKLKNKFGISDDFFGNILVIFHIFIFLVAYYIIFTKKTIIKLILLGLLIIIRDILNIYTGIMGCILTRLERKYYKDKKWFGPTTTIFRWLNIEITKCKMDLMIAIIFIIGYLGFFIN